MKTVLPIEDIQKITFENNKVIIIYKDGSKLIGNADEISIESGYKNKNDQPIVDHCI